MLNGDSLAKAVARVAVAVLIVVFGHRDDRLCLHLIIYIDRGWVSSAFNNLKIFVVDTADGYGVAGKLHDELAVAVNAYDVALQSLEETGEDTQLDVVLGKLDKRVAQEGHIVGMTGDSLHEGLHHAMGDNRRMSCATVLNKMSLRMIGAEKLLQFSRMALQEYQTIDSGQEFFDDTLAIIFGFEFVRIVDKTLVPRLRVGGIVGVNLTLEEFDLFVMDMDISPRSF